MTYWAQLLHFYQPPTQTHEVLRRVADESYRPLLAVLKEHPGAKLAININGVLTELLLEHGMGDIVAGLRELGERGQVEFVAAASTTQSCRSFLRPSACVQSPKTPARIVERLAMAGSRAGSSRPRCATAATSCSPSQPPGTTG